MTRVALTICLASCGFLGCWTGSSRYNPAVDRRMHPGPIVMAKVARCFGDESGPSGGKLITRHAPYGVMAADLLDESLARLGSVETDAGLSCSDLDFGGVKDTSSFELPLPPRNLAALTQGRPGSMVFTPAIRTKVHCSNEGSWVGQTFVSTGTSECRETEIELLAFLFSANGVLVWKWVHGIGIGNETPNIEPGVRKLLEEAPLSSAALKK